MVYAFDPSPLRRPQSRLDLALEAVIANHAETAQSRQCNARCAVTPLVGKGRIASVGRLTQIRPVVVDRREHTPLILYGFKCGGAETFVSASVVKSQQGISDSCSAVRKAC